jgi:hypothetical protein
MLAGASVLIGPVSVANSLLTGKFTGNFADLRQFSRSGADSLGNFNHLRRISLLNETGNYFGSLGNSAMRIGNFARLRNMTWSFASHDSVLCSRSLAHS